MSRYADPELPSLQQVSQSFTRSRIWPGDTNPRRLFFFFHAEHSTRSHPSSITRLLPSLKPSVARRPDALPRSIFCIASAGYPSSPKTGRNVPLQPFNAFHLIQLPPMRSHVLMRLFPFSTNMNPGPASRMMRRLVYAAVDHQMKESVVRALLEEESRSHRMPLFRGTEGHRYFLSLEGQAAFYYLRSRCSGDAGTDLPTWLINSMLIKARPCATSGTVSPFPTQSSGASEEDAHFSRSLRTAAHLGEIAADTQVCAAIKAFHSIYSTQSLRHKHQPG